MMKKPSFNSLKKVLKNMSRLRVAVVGDLILDNYIWGKVKRISPEAPVPVVEVENMDYRLGGAANVAAGVAALGAEVNLVGMLGDDIHGRELALLLENRGISAQGVITDGERPTTLKTRVIAHSQQVVRYDREFVEPPARKTETRLEKLFFRLIDDAKIVILSDYDKGIFKGALARKAIKAATERGVKVAADPKVPNIKRFGGAYVITPNHREAAQVAGFPLETDGDVQKAGKILLKKLRCPNVLITLGKRGMSLCREDNDTVHVPTIARQVFDVTGAGDTVIAVLAVAVAAGAAMEQAMWLANAAAGVTVGRIGTAAVTPEEIELQLEEEYALL